jgi:hypothetical protein
MTFVHRSAISNATNWLSRAQSAPRSGTLSLTVFRGLGPPGPGASGLVGPWRPRVWGATGGFFGRWRQIWWVPAEKAATGGADPPGSNDAGRTDVDTDTADADTAADAHPDVDTPMSTPRGSGGSGVGWWGRAVWGTSVTPWGPRTRHLVSQVPTYCPNPRHLAARPACTPTPEAPAPNPRYPNPRSEPRLCAVRAVRMPDQPEGGGRRMVTGQIRCVPGGGGGSERVGPGAANLARLA